MELSRHELAIWKDAAQLYRKSVTLDLEHDGHAVFQMVGETAKQLTVKHGFHPLACQIARLLTDCWITRWYSVNGKTAA